MMDSILINNGFLVTMDKNRRILDKGSVFIENNRIIDVGKANKLKKRYRPDISIDATDKAVLPGFVSTHTHLYQTLLKNMGADLSLMEWLPAIIFSTSNYFHKEESYYGALLGCLELIRSGCTCIVDHGLVTKDQNITDHCIKALLESGIRAIEAKATRDADVFGMASNEMLQDTEEAIRSCIQTIEKWHGSGDGRLKVWFGAGSIRTCSKKFLKEAVKLANKYEIGICIHLQESKDEVVEWKKRFNTTPIKYLHEKIDFLAPNVLVAHCVWVNDEDIHILKKTKAKVSHNPISNMYLASGIAPIPKLLRSGVTVGLGDDGASCSGSPDMFELMKTTVLLQKAYTLNPKVLSANKALEMATIKGAEAIGLEKEIGSIEPGKKADVILLDLKKPNMVPLHDVSSQLVYCGKASNVNTVIIDGRVVMENRKMMLVDERYILGKAQELSDSLIKRANIGHLKKFWSK